MVSVAETALEVMVDVSVDVADVWVDAAVLVVKEVMADGDEIHDGGGNVCDVYLLVFVLLTEA